MSVKDHHHSINFALSVNRSAILSVMRGRERPHRVYKPSKRANKTVRISIDLKSGVMTVWELFSRRLPYCVKLKPGNASYHSIARVLLAELNCSSALNRIDFDSLAEARSCLEEIVTTVDGARDLKHEVEISRYDFEIAPLPSALKKLGKTKPKPVHRRS